MKGLMQKINETNYPQMNRTASEEYVGVQTFMKTQDERLVECNWKQTICWSSF